ncbi:MAG TPA: hypothetical protein VFV81_01325, partial [Verrucomicrobiae bacterium]|nr:hypothetical protein [Verrucomicrobiae bacterium]
KDLSATRVPPPQIFPGGKNLGFVMETDDALWHGAKNDKQIAIRFMHFARPPASPWQVARASAASSGRRRLRIRFPHPAGPKRRKVREILFAQSQRCPYCHFDSGVLAG